MGQKFCPLNMKSFKSRSEKSRVHCAKTRNRLLTLQFLLFLDTMYKKFSTCLGLRNSHRSGEDDANVVKLAKHYITAIFQEKSTR